MRLRMRWTVAALVAAGTLGAAAPARADQPWRDPGQPPATRAAELLAALTPEQKVAIALGDYASVASLGVPALSSDDGPSGIRASGTTALPSSQTLAASFDRSLARAYGDVAASEARGKGFNWWLGPAMDIARTPLSGRQPENLGEDPFLAGETVAQEVAAAKANAVIATLKHYVANNQEFGRIGFAQPDGSRSGGVNVHVDERTLQEIYEAPFKRAIREAGADAVMCSYNRLDGPQTCEDPALLGDLKASGFQGFVAPDFLFAVKDPLRATLAGLDVPALGGPGGRTAAMFTSGQVPAARLDDIVRRTLFAMFDSGAFDHPLGPARDDVSTPAHRDVATRVSTSGMVLLKNDRHALPLSDRAPRSLAVIGPSGTDAIYTTGGSAGVPVDPARAVTPLAGIAARAGGMAVTASQGSLGDVPLPDSVPSSALGGGLRATYWNNGDFQGAPALTRTEPTLDLSAAPAGVGRPWSARWTGTLTPTETGLYRFSLLQAGLARVYIDGRLVASGYREGTSFVAGPPYPLQAAVRLTAGRPASIRVEYTSKAQLFGAQLHLAWQPPSASRIPAAVAAARHADAAVVIVDEAQGEGMDRSTLALPGDQDALIEAVAAANRRTIVVLDNGGPVLMPWLNRVSAVVEAWYPGQQFGAALASVLFGDSDPGGRLPVTFPASDFQGPAPVTRPERYPGIDNEVRYDEGLLVGYRWYDATGQRPLFPFGYGLSYTRTRIDDLRVWSRGDHVTASVRVTNVGDRAGWAVPQAYLSYPNRGGEPPWQLKGYEKVGLAPRQSRTVTFRLGAADLSVFDHRTVVPDGRYRLAVGTSSRDFDRVATFDLGRW
jgi:beta-glucosidase